MTLFKFYFLNIMAYMEIEGYVIRVDRNKLFNYGVDNIIHKYLSQGKSLSEGFPNHEVELQLEIIGGVKQSTVLPQPQRRYVRVLKKPVMRQPNNAPEDAPAVTAPSSKTTTSFPTHAVSTLPSPRTFDDPRNRPVYMEDLNKALEDFEKKLTATTNRIADIQHTTTSSPVKLVNRNIEGIIELIRKGIRLESQPPDMTDDRLDWLQIKIPKNAK